MKQLIRGLIPDADALLRELEVINGLGALPGAAAKSPDVGNTAS